MTIVWDDDVTQLDAEHMNQLEQITRKAQPNGYASLGADGLVPPAQLPPAAPPDALKVDKDSVVVAATRLVASRLLAGDAEPAFRILGNGKHEWGPGGATVPTTNLYSTTIGLLKTDTDFQAQAISTDLGMLIAPGTGNQIDLQGASGRILFGSARDTRLYRQSAGVLRTDGTLDANALTINGVPVGGAADLTVKVDKDSVVASGTRIVANKLLAGDAQPAFRIMASGTIGWGVGGAAAIDTTLGRAASGGLSLSKGPLFLRDASGPNNLIFFGANDDTNLYREAAGVLATDSALLIHPGANEINIGWGGFPSAAGIYFANDTNLYRLQAGVLATDGQFIAKSHGSFNWNTANEVHLGHNGGVVAPAIYFGNAADTNLYRAGATVLKTDGVLYVGSNVVAKQGLAQQVFIGDLGDTVPSLAFGLDTAVTLRRYGNDLSFFGSKFQFGGAFDANLYRASAGNLKTDTSFTAGASLVVATNDPNGAIYFGSALDTKLYRSAAGELTAPGKLIAGHLQASAGAARVEAGNIYDGTKAAVVWGGDTGLYRVGANQLQTDGYLYTGLAIYAQKGAATQVGLVAYQGAYPAVNFGSAGDTVLYRSAANTLETPGTLNMGAMGINVPGVGGRIVEFGGPDSGGAGYRMMRVTN